MVVLLRLFTTAAVLLLSTACSSAPAGTPPVSVNVRVGGDCGVGGTQVESETPRGIRWSWCWQNDSAHGPVLTEVSYRSGEDATPIRIVESIYLAEVHMAYDAGDARTLDSDFGFGRFRPVTEQECGGTLVSADSTLSKPALCVRPAKSPLGQIAPGEQGASAPSYGVEVFSVATVEHYTYVIRYTLAEDGTVQGDLGATGSLRPESGDHAKHDHGRPLGRGNTGFATSHFHNAFWRVEWALGDGPTRVKRRTSTPQGANTRTTDVPVDVESAEVAASEQSWLVESRTSLNEDGRAIGYEIERPLSAHFRSTETGEDFLNADVYFTRRSACETDVVNKGQNECAANLTDYVNSEPLDDVVSWIQVSFHHVPRDEDQDPMPLHWQGFVLRSTGLTARNPLGG